MRLGIIGCGAIGTDVAIYADTMNEIEKIYLFDNGIASAIHYSFSEDRGKLFENIVFTHLRTLTEDLFFLKRPSFTMTSS